jgi:transposase
MGRVLKNKFFTYSYDLKKEAVELYYAGYSRVDIAERFGIKNVRMVNEWVRKVEKEGWEGLKDRRGQTKGPGKGRPAKRTLTLEEENQRLKAENLYLKKLLEQKRGC